MRHEKHTQSSSIPQALVLPNNAVAADPMPTPLNYHLGLLKHSPLNNIFAHLTCIMLCIKCINKTLSSAYQSPSELKIFVKLSLR